MKGNGRIYYPRGSAPWFRAIKRWTERKREKRRRCLERRAAGGPLRSQKERDFVGAFAPRLGNVVAVLVGVKVVPKALVVEVGRSATKDAGYRAPRDGKTNGNSVNHLLRLPRVQNALHEKFDAAGLTLDRSFEIMAEIAQNRELTPADRLRAIDMRIKMTVGYAPTKSASITANVTPDQFFDATFEGRPPDITIEHDPKAP